MTDQPDEDVFVDPADDAAGASQADGSDELPADDFVDHEPAVDEPAVDQPEEVGVLDDDSAPATGAVTGHPAVDEVLRSLEGLDARPVDEHVAAFEQAHDVLRRALSDAGDDTVSREG
jgi:hypothetical protein